MMKCLLLVALTVGVVVVPGLRGQESESLVPGSYAPVDTAEGVPAIRTSNPSRLGLPGPTTVFRRRASRKQPVIRAGTLIPALLYTGANSDLPGDLIGQVSRDVYDSEQRVVLIPAGSRLIGQYDNQIAAGQNRLVVAWNLLQFADGSSIELPALNIADRQGATGVEGDVNNHYGRIFGNAFLLSALGAGFQLSQPAQGGTFAAPSAGQQAAGAVGSELNQVATEIIRRNLKIQPTVRVAPGSPFLVFVNRDLIIESEN